MAGEREWVNEAVRRIEADFNRSADTHLFRLAVPGVRSVDLYLKDESTHPTGSLKHRLARSLFLYALCNGWVAEGTTVIEASSGSTAVSEAYFAQLLGLPFVAVMPKTTSAEKIAQIEFYGGQCHLVDDPGEVYAESRRLADERRGHYMDQFTYAERATDWRGNNNIAESVFAQMALEPHPVPRWIVWEFWRASTAVCPFRCCAKTLTDSIASIPGWASSWISIPECIEPEFDSSAPKRSARLRVVPARVSAASTTTTVTFTAPRRRPVARWRIAATGCCSRPWKS